MKNNFIAIAYLTCLTLIFASCSSIKNHGMDVNPDDKSIVDWDGRNYDYPAKPEWLKQINNPKSEKIKKEFGIDKSYIIKYGIGSGKTEEAAKTSSRLSYNAIRAEELRTEVVSEASKIVNAEATGSIAMKAPVVLTGHELVTQFWQEVETYNSEEDVKTRKIICYSLYKISEDNWKKTLKEYFKTVIAQIPDSAAQKELASKITNVYENTTREIPEEEFTESVNAKINAIETGTPNSASPAPNPKDLEWLKVLETACDLIF